MSNSAAHFRSVVLTSADPSHTALFYQFVVGLELEAVGTENETVAWTTECGDVEFAIHHTDALPNLAAPPLPRSNLTHLYFKMKNQAEFLGRLSKLGIFPISISDGKIALEDPDGRVVIFGA